MPEHWYNSDLTGEPYMWDGCDSAQDFACFHDPEDKGKCPEGLGYSPSSCSASVPGHSKVYKRDSGSHPSSITGKDSKQSFDTFLEDKECSTGIDCSGLVSQAWGLTHKVGTPKDDDPDNWDSLQYKADPLFQVEIVDGGIQHPRAIGPVESLEGGFWKPVNDGESLWDHLKPGDAIVEPGSHVTLVDYVVQPGEASQGACVWEASGHRKYIENGETQLMEETAHHGFINDTWLQQGHIGQVFRIYRFVGAPPIGPAMPDKDLCDAPICYHNGLCFDKELTFRAALGVESIAEVIISNQTSRTLSFKVESPVGADQAEFRLVSTDCDGQFRSGYIANASLAPNGKCKIGVRFHPKTGTTTVRTAQIVFESASPQTLALWGYIRQQ